MKKIVAAAAAALLLAGAAFADVSFSWTGTGIVGGTSKALDSVERNDCLSLKVSNDIAGVVFDWDISGDDTITETKDGSTWTKVKDGKNYDLSATSKSKLSLDTYYGWLTYGLPVGNLQVTSGKWTARYVDRVNTDAGDLDGNYYEAYKPGVIVVGKVAEDSDNLTTGKMSTILAYTLADTLPGTLLVKGGIVSGAYGKYDSQSNFAGEVAYRQENVINANIALKMPVKDVMSIGVFVSPLMVEKLQATAGFSFGSAKKGTKYNNKDAANKEVARANDESEFGIDLRARYALSDATAVTGMFNYSSYDSGASGADPVKAMWTMVSFNHVAGDNIRFLATLQNTVRDFDAEYGKNLTAFTPACEIKASEKATVTAAFDIRWDNKRPYAGLGDVSLPIYVSFSL